MTANTLEPGKPRIGWLVDGNPDTPQVSVMLQDTGDDIVLTVPYQSWFAKDPYERWFSPNVQFGDDPDRTKYDYRPPYALLFQDDLGSVVLAGCRAGRTRWNMSHGQGDIHAQFIIFGGTHLKYEKVNGLRSEVPGLAEWAGIRSLTQEHHVDDDNRLKSLTVKLESPPEVKISHHMNLALRPSFRTSRPAGADTLAIHEALQVQTTFTRPRPWVDHLQGHQAMRELLVISAWAPFGFSTVWAKRGDDPERFMSGDPLGPRWAEVRTRRLHANEELRTPPRFLFTYDDIGVSGIRQWIKIRKHFRRTIQPLIAIRDQKDAHWETRMVQSGIALEALGFQLAVDGGMSPSKNIKYKNALQSIVDDLPINPLIDIDDWIQRSRDCYMGVKHADNPSPDLLVLANTLRENLLIMRLWISGQIGVKSTILHNRLQLDTHAVPLHLA